MHTVPVSGAVLHDKSRLHASHVLVLATILMLAPQSTFSSGVKLAACAQMPAVSCTGPFRRRTANWAVNSCHIIEGRFQLCCNCMFTGRTVFYGTVTAISRKITVQAYVHSQTIFHPCPYDLSAQE
ncbi:hypothetical protein BDP27DRAFT_834954 [Rhodocollybia butyracea]|uniref:Uncharacterized protein n=1 Tax=Rhodocollybia butyracea TaxID=206335 RepID=A0A9P5PRY8_9AGAR|nr:hypothetical protein BDP27DRAFT_834954 [Rhodocollybia butyracea]